MADGLGDAPKAGENAERIVIKKYANRRLYNTGASAYVTLEHLAELVRKGADFVVYDAKTNEDITRQVLTQIIFDEETRGQNILPIQFLRQLIRMYGDQMQTLMAPAYLEASLDAFAKQQEAFREQFSTFTATGKASGNPFEDQVRANLALFDSAMKMFNPFTATVPGAKATAAPEPAPAPAAPADDTLAEMRRRMEEMQAQIERLAKR
jgi:polyhydroxyalkanoate synthesis repressor PhaR